MIDVLDTRVTLVPRDAFATVHATGVAASKCVERKCTRHTSDWREPPGSLGNWHRVTAEPTITLRDVFTRNFSTPALCTGYVVARDGVPLDHSPRLAKDSLPWLRTEGFEVLAVCLIADVDCPKHDDWNDQYRAEFDAFWHSGSELLATCGMYTSARGYRLVQPLADPLPVDEAEPRLWTWLKALVAAGAWESALECKDWTHLMRVANPRKKSGPYRSEWVSTERMAAIDAPAPTQRAAAARRAPRRVNTNATQLTDWTADVPAGWEHAADMLGAAIRDHVRSDWRRAYLCLAAALCERGCPADGVPAVIARAHAVDQSYPEWEALLGDRHAAACSTVVRWVNGQELMGYSTLRREFPGLADALDAATVDGVEARVLRQIAAPAPRPMPVADAVAAIRRTIEQAYGVTVVAAPPGTGKTHAVAEHARGLPTIDGRARPGSRIAVSAPRHDLARQTAAKLPRSLHVFSPPSLVGPDGTPVCAFAEQARALAAGRQSVRRSFCDGGGGKNATPCELADGCAARDGIEGDADANLVVGVHGLVRELRAYAGTQGVLVVDEPGEVTVIDRITLDELEGARRFLDHFSFRYTGKIAPALAAFTAWVRDAGPVEGALVSVQDAVRAAAHLVPEGELEAAELGDTPPEDLPDAVLVAAAEAIHPAARTDAPPLTQRAVALARASAARATELGAASRVLDLLWRAITSTVQFCARIDERSGERAVSVVSINADFAIALQHEGPVVVLDANAGIHLAAITRLLGGTPPAFVDLAVADGAPIARTVLATGNATRRGWMPHGVPDWPSILPALRAALAWASRDPSTQRIGLITPKEMHTAFAHALRPDAPETQALVTASRFTRRVLDEVRKVVAPVLATFAGEILTGHYGALEGLDFMADCDATITLVDPRPNLGDEQLRAEYLGLEHDGRLDALAAAELQQAHGRLRTIHRTRPGRQLHVGSVVPAGWAGLDVEVQRLPVGRPRTIDAGMTGDDLRAARVAAGMGVRELARALRKSDGTVRRYESGECAIPARLVEMVRALAPGAPETPSKNISSQGVSGASSVQVPATGVFRRSDTTAALQGVSGAVAVTSPDEPPPVGGGGAPRRARRVDLKALLEASQTSPAPMARAAGDDWRSE